MTIRAAVLTVSDRCARGEATDASGPAIASLLRDRIAAEIVATACVPDEPGAIATVIRSWAHVALVVTTGGTGLSPRDRTPEAIRPLLDREAPGLMELARSRTASITPLAYLSRGIAGTMGSTLVLTLPGSPKGAVEQLSALLDVLPHALAVLAATESSDSLHRPRS
ncbi:MAG: MogA/MoaB family molybdenum cofactor biosynthesis protein [Phycisphaerae bacterium]|nr:MogA/MoaB family molybdenum cofactor biosynthesis protein [Phycisphaerae bacterium]